MAIKFPQPPQESVNALNSTLRGLTGGPQVEITPLRNFDLRSLGGSEPTLPHQVYSLGLDDLLQGRGLKDARLVSWRYFVPTNQSSLASAEVNVDPAGGHKFAQLNTGPFNESTRSAVESLMNDPHVANHSYELRLMRIPALYVQAIWLKSDGTAEDYVVPLAPTIPILAAGEFYSVPDFEERVRKAAREKKSGPSPARLRENT